MAETIDCTLTADHSPITVGEIMWLKCEALPVGEGYQIDDEEARQSAEKKDPHPPAKDLPPKGGSGHGPQQPVNKMYRLVLLSRENTEKGLKVTSYRVGDHQIGQITLISGETQYKSSPLQFSVQSVIEPNTQVQPFPSFPPVMTGLPTSFLVSVLLTFFVFVVATVYSIVRRRRRRAYLKQLRESEGFAAPYSHFHQTLRNLRKLQLHRDQPMNFIQGLEPALRIYLEQTFQYPIVLRDPRWINQLKQRPQEREELRTFAVRRLAELFRVQRLQTVSVADAEQMDKEISALVDRLEPSLAPFRGKR